MVEKKRYTVIRDTREQEGNGWIFPESDFCSGTIDRTMKSGDYTLEGFEDVLAIERKRSTGELSKNVYEKRFERELERLEDIKHSFLFFEFNLEDVISFPFNSGIPKYKWGRLRVTSQFMLKKIMEWQVRYKTKILFVGKKGMATAGCLFKRVIEDAERAKSSG